MTELKKTVYTVRPWYRDWLNPTKSRNGSSAVFVRESGKRSPRKFFENPGKIFQPYFVRRFPVKVNFWFGSLSVGTIVGTEGKNLEVGLSLGPYRQEMIPFSYLHFQRKKRLQERKREKGKEKGGGEREREIESETKGGEKCKRN